MLHSMHGICGRVTGLAVLLGLLANLGIPAAAKAPEKVRVGVVASLFRGIPQKTIDASVEPFKALMEAKTGSTGELETIQDPFDVADQLTKDKLELGIFHGVEFAWVKQKYPELRPLMIAVNQERYLQAYLLVGKKRPVKDFASLKGKTLAIPDETKEHCRMFLNRLLKKSGQDVKHYFAKTTKPANIEDALDDVVDGLVSAALVDGIGLLRYQKRKPGRFKQLRELEKSAEFPASVVVYHAGALDEDTLERYRTALREAPDNPDGRQTLTMWKLTGFESMPRDYPQQLAAILKIYPPPVKDSK